MNDTPNLAKDSVTANLSGSPKPARLLGLFALATVWILALAPATPAQSSTPAPARVETTATDTALAGRAIPAQIIPVPSTVSVGMQQEIAKASPSNLPMTPRPTTNAGWHAFENPDPTAAHARNERWLRELQLDLQEQVIGGVHCYILTPSDMPARNRRRLLLNTHGGAYTGGAGENGLYEAILAAGISRMKTIAVDYRTPPDHPFPAAIDDAVTVWKHVVKHYPVARIGIFGTSTGGALVLSLVQRANAEGLPIPAAVVAGTPWADLSETGDSYFTNRYLDPMVYRGALEISALQYAHGVDLKDPRLSPIYGSFAHFPPTLILSGTRDLFLSNSLRVDRKIRDAGGHSELIVYEGQAHGWYLKGPEAAETQTAMKDLATFFDRHLAQ